MPGSRNRHRKKKYSSSSSSDSSSSCSDSDSYQSDSSINNKKRHNRKKHSESNSEVACYSNDKKCKHDSSDSSDCESEYKLCDIYAYFRNRLLEDKHLMVAGSSAYANAVNNTPEVIQSAHSLSYNTDLLQYNIERTSPYSPFYVREDGIYILFIVVSVDVSCQFTVFVNGVVNPNTCIGTNSGAGQVVSRHLLSLKKDDHVVVRNYLSSNSVKAALYAGGLDPGNDLSFLMMKVAPSHQPERMCDKECMEFMKCLSRSKKKLFNCLTNKLKDDHELMVRGFNVAGTFYTTASQQVLTNSGVAFDSISNANGLVWNPSGSDPTQVQVLEDGVYKLFFLATTNNPAQFSIAVNGTVVPTTTQGSNKGAGQITIRTLEELKAGDIVQVFNYLSANGMITISNHCGGPKDSVSAILTVFKIAPLVKPQIQQVDCKLAERFECYYEKFRTFLLCNPCLQIEGSSSYHSLVAGIIQNIAPSEAFNWPTNVLLRNTHHQQGTPNVVIERSGVYDIFVDVCTDEALQYAVFVNGVPEPSTIFGRDSGANRCLIRQFLKLNKGDVLTVNNYESNQGTVNTVENAGGSFISLNALWMAILLSPSCCEPTCCLPPPPCHPHSNKHHSNKSQSNKSQSNKSNKP
jgi:hypothetical protein